MKRVHILLIALLQVILSAVLLNIGRKQVPSASQDYPPFVGSATKTSEAINAPVILLQVLAIGIVRHWTSADLGNLGIIWTVLYLIAVFLFWWIIGTELKFRIKRRAEHKSWRIALDFLGLAIGSGLIFLAAFAQRQDEAILSWGAAIWAAMIVGASGQELFTFVRSFQRRTAI